MFKSYITKVLFVFIILLFVVTCGARRDVATVEEHECSSSKDQSFTGTEQARLVPAIIKNLRAIVTSNDTFNCQELYTVKETPFTLAFPYDASMGVYPTVSLFSNRDTYVDSEIYHEINYYESGGLSQIEEQSLYNVSEAISFQAVGDLAELNYYGEYKGNLEVVKSGVYAKNSILPIITFNNAELSVSDFYLNIDGSFDLSFSSNVDAKYRVFYTGTCEDGQDCDTNYTQGFLISEGEAVADTDVVVSIVAQTNDYLLHHGILNNKFHLEVVSHLDDTVSTASFFLGLDTLEPSIAGKVISIEVPDVVVVNEDVSFEFYSIEPLALLKYTYSVDGSTPDDPAESGVLYSLGDMIQLIALSDTNQTYLYRYYAIDLAGNVTIGTYSLLLDQTIPTVTSLLVEAVGSKQAHKVAENRVVLQSSFTQNFTDGFFNLLWSVPINLDEEQDLSVTINLVDLNNNILGELFSISNIASLFEEGETSVSLSDDALLETSIIFISSVLDYIDMQLIISKTSEGYNVRINSVKINEEFVQNDCSLGREGFKFCVNTDNLIALSLQDKAGNSDTVLFFIHIDDKVLDSVVTSMPLRDTAYSCSPSDSDVCDLHFSWQALSSIEEIATVRSYIIELSNSSTFDSIYYTQTLEATSIDISFGDSTHPNADIKQDNLNGKNYWRIRYVDGVSNELVTSTRYSHFTLGQSNSDIIGSVSGDLVVGSPNTEDHNKGKVYIFAGEDLDSCDLLATDISSCFPYSSTGNASIVITGEDNGFGNYVGFIPDVTGDQKAELLITSHQYNNDAGKIYVIKSDSIISKCSTFAITTCELTIETLISGQDYFSDTTGETGAELGFSATYIGDHTKDGYSDFIVSAPLAGDISGGADLQSGAVYIYAFNTDNTNFSFVRKRLQISGLNNIGGSARLGYSLCNIGDLNEDGQPEIFIGAPYARYQSSTDIADVATSRGIGYVVYSTLENDTQVGSLFVGSDSFSVIESPDRSSGGNFGASCEKGYDLSGVSNSPFATFFLVGASVASNNFGKVYFYGVDKIQKRLLPLHFGEIFEGVANGLFSSAIQKVPFGQSLHYLVSAPDINTQGGSIYSFSDSNISFTSDAITTTLDDVSLSLFEGYDIDSNIFLDTNIKPGIDLAVFADVDEKSILAAASKDYTKLFVYLGDDFANLETIQIENTDLDKSNQMFGFSIASRE